jgi:hypothetical protein
MTDQSPPTSPTQDTPSRKSLIKRIAQLREVRQARSDTQAATEAKARADERMDALATYWASLRRGNAIPKRADLDPRDISGLLPDMVLLEKIAPGMGRMRVTGTRVGLKMGMNLRGMPLSVLFAVEDREALRLHLNDLFAEGTALDMQLEAPAGFGRAALPARLSLLPLRDGMGEVTRAVGLFLPLADVDAKMRRFKILHCDCGAVLAPGPAPTEASIESPPPPRKETPPAPILTHRSKGAPHLRLVHSV